MFTLKYGQFQPVDWEIFIRAEVIKSRKFLHRFAKQLEFESDAEQNTSMQTCISS